MQLASRRSFSTKDLIDIFVHETHFLPKFSSVLSQLEKRTDMQPIITNDGFYLAEN
jgi:hypothetical protein